MGAGGRGLALRSLIMEHDDELLMEARAREERDAQLRAEAVGLQSVT